MSTVTMDASTAPAFERAARQPAFAVKRRRELDGAGDAPPLDRPRQVFPERKVVYKIATRRAEIHAALRLVYKAYVSAGLSAKHPYRMRVTPYHLLPTTEVFVATLGGEVVCTMSLVRDGELGLPMERIYGHEIAWRREKGISFAEVSCLAERQHSLVRSLPVLIQVMGLMAQCARRRGVDELLIAVHPRHAPFYQRFIGFEVIGPERVYQGVRNKPAVALALDLRRLAAANPRAYKRFFGTPFPVEVLEERPTSGHLRSELRRVMEANHVGEPGLERELLAAS